MEHQPTDRRVEFLFAGVLGSQGQGLFSHCQITSDHSHTRVVGPVSDRAALHGLLKRIRDMNLNLVAFRYLD